MRLVVSNIAWRPEEDLGMARLLAAAGVDAVEVAPTRLWPQPLDTSAAEVARYVGLWRSEGVEVVSMQALLFGRPDLQIFADAQKRAETLHYLRGIAQLAASMGARKLVFGSPGNRKVGDLDRKQAWDIACDFFAAAGRDAAQAGVQLCIEPNPPAYACDFVTTAAEGLALVQAVNEPGFGLHLDAAGLQLAGDDPAAAVLACGSATCHVHLSAPQLGRIQRDAVVDYAGVIAALRQTAYAGLLSMEMRAASATGDNRPFVAESVGYIRQLLAA
jgi:D-psicose/D-tagatose/L-ribulose 3-epimerase